MASPTGDYHHLSTETNGVAPAATQATASPRAITLNLITMGLGTGLLTMPWGTAGASLLTSLALLALVLCLNYLTIMTIVRACDRWQMFDLGALLLQLPGGLGPPIQMVTNCIIYFSQFLVLLGYVIVIVDSALKALAFVGFVVQRGVLASLVALVLVPLGLLDQSYLSFTSTLSIAANVYLIGLLVVCAMAATGAEPTGETPHDDPAPLCLFGLSTGTVTQFSLLMYTIIIQMAIPPMYQELERRTPKIFGKCLAIAFACLFFIFAAVMACGYAAFGGGVNSNVMNNIPQDDWGIVAQVAMGVCIMGCYPLNMKPMLAPLLGAEGAESKSGKTVELAAAAVIVVLTCAAAMWLDSLGSLNAVNGAIQVVGYIGLVPGLTGLYLLGEVPPAQRAAWWGLMVLSVLACAAGAYFTNNLVASLDAACLWSWTPSG